MVNQHPPKNKTKQRQAMWVPCTLSSSQNNSVSAANDVTNPPCFQMRIQPGLLFIVAKLGDVISFESKKMMNYMV
jgi:hypothetical protein